MSDIPKSDTLRITLPVGCTYVPTLRTLRDRHDAAIHAERHSAFGILHCIDHASHEAQAT